MEVKRGFENTELGLKPEEWEIKIAEDICIKIQDGTHFSPRLGGNDHYYITSKNIKDGYLDISTADRIDAQQHQAIYSRCDVQKGDLLLTKDGVNTGNAALNILDDEISLLSSVAFLRFDQNHHDPAFYLQQILNPNYRSYIRALQAGNAITRLTLERIRELRFFVPPFPEQRAIAEVLSDVDALIVAFERLIAKKRAIKQGAMQELLTGKKRLPGFSGEWDYSSLKHVAEIGTGINKSIGEMGSGTLYVTVQDLYDATSIRVERLGRIQVSSAEIQAKKLKVNDIVFGKSSVKRDGIGYPSRFLGSVEPVVFSGFTYRARAREVIADATFLFYSLRMSKTRRWVIDNAQASALTNINQRIADAIPVTLPPLPEQTAIAVVLSDMDAEISALEARREKTRALKLGLMQVLITGRIRLL